MKRFVFVTLLAWAGLAQAAPVTYNIDPMHTYVAWRVSHFGFSHPEGKWMVKSGTITLDKAKPQNSKVNVIIQMDTLDTGIPELNKHLEAPLFFDVAKYPTATFDSTKLVLTGKDTAKVMGTLTLHGVSKSETLNVKLNKAGVSELDNKETVGFDASADLNRSDFGMTAYIPQISDNVQITISAEATRAS